MGFIPEVACHFKEKGCKELVPVPLLKAHMRECKYHPSRTCPRLFPTPEGEEAYEHYIKPAMIRAGVFELAEDLKDPLCCDEALCPGFIDVLAAGYAWDLAESLKPDDDWLPFRTALLEAQAHYYNQCEKVRRANKMQAASRLCAWLFTSLDGDMEEKQAAALDALEGLAEELQLPPSRCITPCGPQVTQRPRSRGCVWLDIPEDGCLAVEAACALEGRERTAEALLQAPDDPCLPSAKRLEVAKVLKRVAIPEEARLVPLQPRPLPEASVKIFRRKLEALRQEYTDDHTNQAGRSLRLQMRDYPWISRQRVEKMMAEFEGRDYSFPKRSEPGYWSAGLQLPGFVYSLVPVDESEIWRFQAAFDFSCVKKTTFDRKGEVADRLIVESVDRVENGKTWSEYVHRRDMIAAERCKDEEGRVPDVEGVKVDYKIFPGQRDLEDPGVLHNVDAQEVYLFHGTNLSGARCIAKQEFSTEFSSEFGLFGPGLYFAESATKSDEYCEEEPEDGLCTILVCRVCLGDHMTVADDEVDANEVMRQLAVLGRHSVLGDREAARGTFREFITYDSSACYPEYIVRYRRAYGLEHAEAAHDARERATVVISRESMWEKMELQASMAMKASSAKPENTPSDCLCRCQ